MTKESAEPNLKEGLWAFLFCVPFGTYLLAGAYWAASKGEWPFFMPPQIDIFGVLFSILGKPWGAYVGALFLVLLGVFFLWFGAATLWRTSRA